MIKKIVKFGIVGAFGLLIDFGVTAFVLYFSGLEELLYHSLSTMIIGHITNEMWVVLFANAFAFAVATTAMYYINRIWTWKSHNPAVTNEYARFFGVAVVGLVVNLGLIYFLGRRCDMGFDIWGYTVQSILVIKSLSFTGALVWNFVANDIFTFRKPTKKELENADDYCDYIDYDNDDAMDNDDDYIPKA